MQKILWVKFGWSDFYRGGPVDGNFKYLDKESKKGHEAWNFSRNPDGNYYCYVPPQGKSGATPSNPDKKGWTVICLAKNPKKKGLYIVGWYKNAELMGKYVETPQYEGDEIISELTPTYCIRSKEAYFILPKDRHDPFSHNSIRQGKYSFLSGPNIVSGTQKQQSNKAEVLDLIVQKLKSLNYVAIKNPTSENAKDWENDKSNPLGGFGDQDHIREVEEAAIEAVKRHFQNKPKTYKCVSREKDNIGYDLDVVDDKDNIIFRVEVKGTSSSEPQFFITRNEYQAITGVENWRMAIVTNALEKPKIGFYAHKEFSKMFQLAPLVWKGSKI